MMKTVILASLLLLLPSLGYAACTLPASTASFGSVTTFVANTTVSSVTTNASVNCGAGSALSLPGNNQITFQLTGATNISGTRGVLKRSGDTGSDNVPVRLCADSACASELTIGSTITAPNISFGSAPLVGSFSAVSQTINVLCSTGSTYTAGLNNGSYPVGSVRNISSGANRLSYESYKSATSNRWGPTGTERWSSTTSTAVSADGLTRGFNYTARILTTQNTPPAGNYCDSVVVDLSF